MTAKPPMSSSPEKRRDCIAQLPSEGTSLEADADASCETLKLPLLRREVKRGSGLVSVDVFWGFTFVSANNIFQVVDQYIQAPLVLLFPIIFSTGISERSCS